jgi:hypothetical protein
MKKTEWNDDDESYSLYLIRKNNGVETKETLFEHAFWNNKELADLVKDTIEKWYLNKYENGKTNS